MVNLFKPCILGKIFLGGDNLYPIEFLLVDELRIILLHVDFHLPKVSIQLLVSTLVSELLFYIWLVVVNMAKTFTMAKTLRYHVHPRERGKISKWMK